MQKQSGNFLLQTLLALTLVFSFMPFVAKRLASRDMAAQMYSAKQSIETVYNAARLYLYDKKDSLPYDVTVLESGNLVTELSAYGLPLGFNPVTSLNQDITFEINKKEADPIPCDPVGELGEETCEGVAETLTPVIKAYVHVRPNANASLKEYQVAELARMIGFFARPDGKNIDLDVPVDVMYTDVVLRKETDENVGFLTELDMGGNNIDSVGNLEAENGVFLEGHFSKLYIDGTNSGVTEKIQINKLNAGNFIFDPEARTSAALTIIGNELNIGTDVLPGTADLGTVGKSGSSPKLNATEQIYAKTFVQPISAGGFTTGEECNWEVGNKFTSTNTELVVSDTAIIAAGLYGTNHEDLGELKITDEAGIRVADELFVNNVTLRDRTIYELAKEDYGHAEMNLYPGGMSSLPDVNISVLNLPTKEDIIIDNPLAQKTVAYGCDTLLEPYLDIRSVATDYNKQSLIQAIVCNYVFWERLERRINMKICIMAGLACDVIK